MRNTAFLVVLLLGVGAALLFRGSDSGEAPPGDDLGTHEIVEPGDPRLAGQDPRLAGRPEPAAPAPQLPSSVIPDVPGPEGLGSLVVRCVEEDSEKPVSGIGVSVVGEGPWGFVTGTTDGRGEAVFPTVPAGDVVVHASGGGWVSDGIEIDVRPGGAARCRVDLLEALRLRGTVRAATGGRPIPGAVVVVRAGGTADGAYEFGEGRSWGAVETDASGAFETTWITRGRIVTLEVTARGCAPATQGVRVRRGAVVRILLERGGTLRGVVLGKGGPVPGARVVIASTMRFDEPDPEEHGAVSVFTDDRGRFAADSLPLYVRMAAGARADGYASSGLVRDLVLEGEAPAQDIVLRLRAAASASIRVHGADGQPLPGASAAIGFGRLGSGLRLAEGITDAAGRVHFPVLEPGLTQVRVQVADYAPWRQRLVLVEGVLSKVEVHMDPGASIKGVLVDDRGMPIPDAEVRAERYREPRAQARTDAEGAFLLRGLTSHRAHSLHVLVDGHIGSRTEPVAAPAGSVRLVATREGTLRARLVPPAGFVAPTFQIMELVQGGGDTRWEGAWKDGVVEHRLAPGEHRVRLGAEGLQRSEWLVAVEPGEILDLGDVFLERAGAWHGVVVDVDGRPIPGATVMRLPEILDPVLTDADGRFTLPDPGSVPQTLAAQAAGYRDFLKVIESVPVAPLRLVLAREE